MSVKLFLATATRAPYFTAKHSALCCNSVQFGAALHGRWAFT